MPCLVGNKDSALALLKGEIIVIQQQKDHPLNYTNNLNFNWHKTSLSERILLILVKGHAHFKTRCLMIFEVTK